MKAEWLAFALMTAAASSCLAQEAKPVGVVSPVDADVLTPGHPGVQVESGRATVTSGATVTARAGHNAELVLTRGGSVLVCQSTAVRVTPAKGDGLLLALDRGAIEVRMKAAGGDVVMTPDLRFAIADAGTLDLRMRVTFNGDTCVENRGRKAPQLNIADAFGEASYLLKPGQHVMFEHGSLREVDDHETTPCGCPPVEKTLSGVSIADAILGGGQTTPAQRAAAEHPFPAAVSDGLAAPAAPAPEAAGERHVEVTSTLAFDPSAATAAPSVAPPVTNPAPAAAQAAPPVAPRRDGPFAAIGHFFKRLFVH